MRRTNILLEFSDEVYDTLVEPLKKNKAFTKLVTTLIDGYMSDSYIRAYADDTLDGMRNKAVSSFNESIASMNETLSEMGLVTDELEANSLGGRDMFRKKAEDQAEELNKTVGTVGSVSSEELSAVNDRIDKVQDSIQGMMSMLSELIQTGKISIGVMGDVQTDTQNIKVTTSLAKEEAKEVFVETPNSVEKTDVRVGVEPTISEPVAKEGYNPSKSPIFISSEDNSSDEGVEGEDSSVANDFLASMLAGNAYEY